MPALTSDAITLAIPISPIAAPPLPEISATFARKFWSSSAVIFNPLSALILPACIPVLPTSPAEALTLLARTFT